MLFVADTMIGKDFGDYLNHLTDLGGVPLNNTTRSTGDFQLNGDGSVHCVSTAEALTYYPIAAPAADYFVQATIIPRNLGNTVSSGIGARLDSATYTGVILRHEPSIPQWKLAVVLNGGLVSASLVNQTLTVGQAYLVRLECVRQIAEAFIDGVSIATAPLTAIPAAGHAGLNAQVNAVIGGAYDISALTAGTFITPPITQQIAVFPDSGISALYAPAVGLVKSSLTFYQAARNTVLKDTYADAAWDWIIHTVPPDLIFGNA